MDEECMHKITSSSHYKLRNNNFATSFKEPRTAIKNGSNYVILCYDFPHSDIRLSQEDLWHNFQKFCDQLFLTQIFDNNCDLILMMHLATLQLTV